MRYLKQCGLHLLPQQCLLCLNNTKTRFIVCDSCLTWLTRLPSGCTQCALPMQRPESRHCGQCLTHQQQTDQALACFSYTHPIRSWIQLYKFKQHLYLHPLFCYCIQQLCSQLLYPYDLIIPMPIYTQRLRERGFNQCDLIAKRLAKILNRPYASHILQRKKATRPQLTLPAHQRWHNVANSFNTSVDISDLSILVIEDIITTGATIHAAASSLKEQGAKHVSVCALARAIPL